MLATEGHGGVLNTAVVLATKQKYCASEIESLAAGEAVINLKLYMETVRACDRLGFEVTVAPENSS